MDYASPSLDECDVGMKNSSISFNQNKNLKKLSTIVSEANDSG